MSVFILKMLSFLYIFFSLFLEKKVDTLNLQYLTFSHQYKKTKQLFKIKNQFLQRTNMQTRNNEKGVSLFAENV